MRRFKMVEEKDNTSIQYGDYVIKVQNNSYFCFDAQGTKIGEGKSLYHAENIIDHYAEGKAEVLKEQVKEYIIMMQMAETNIEDVYNIQFSKEELMDALTQAYNSYMEKLKYSK